jgi:UDP-N-acetylmuramoyl-tripeptide--D-alanyl-D-alanine ligase
MTAEFTAEDIIDICGGRLAQGLMPDGAGQISTDTRAVQEGQWYLALAGETFDGHDFLGDAFSGGAMGAIVSERTSYPIGNSTFPLMAVQDSLTAYHDLARNWRRRINPKVVGVSGSSGKTTTKEMCAAVFGAALRCHKSRHNENNEFGVPKTLLSMPDDTQVAVIEMAMRGLGQIDQLARCAAPDVGIITNAGSAHLELLGSLENIARAKCELLKNLRGGGVAIIGRQSPELMQVLPEFWQGRTHAFDESSVTVIGVTETGTRFKVKQLESTFEVRAHGEPLLQDAWCVIIAAYELGVDEQLIARGLRMFEAVGGRGNRMIGRNGSLVIDESYNGNPDSVKASVSGILSDTACPHKKRIVVVGELAELGPQGPELHRELGSWLKDKSLSALITVGHLARNIAEGAQGATFEVIPCSDQAEAEAELNRRLDSDACILIKGSRRAALDRLVSRLAAEAVVESEH